jgi:uncharacterized RDD family membrane protein YckC
LILTGLSLLLGILVSSALAANDEGWEIVLQLAVIGMALAYYAGCESSEAQATPGKQAMGLMVLKGNGERLTFMDALLRWLAKFASVVSLGIGFLFPLWTEKRQTLHDLMVGAVVVQRKKVDA